MSGHHLHLWSRVLYAQAGNILPSYVKLHARGSVDAAMREQGCLRLPRVHGRRTALPLMADERPARSVQSLRSPERGNRGRQGAGRVALWYGMTGIDYQPDYDNTRAHLGEFAIMHAAHLVFCWRSRCSPPLAPAALSPSRQRVCRMIICGCSSGFSVVSSSLTVPLGAVYTRLGSRALLRHVGACDRVLRRGCDTVPFRWCRSQAA